MEVEACVDFAGVPLLSTLQEKLRVQLDGIKTVTNELSSIERMIQELMQKREDKLYEIEDMKAIAEGTQAQIDECKRSSITRLQLLKKRYNCVGSSFSLFDLLPPELYVHIFKYLSPRDLCKAAMLTSRHFHKMCQSDVIWSLAFRERWGIVDDRACRTCRALAPASAPAKKDADAARVQRKEVDGDAMMGDLVAGLEKLDVSWMAGFKHRNVVEANWKTTNCSVSTLYGHSDWVTCLMVVDDLLVSGSFDATIKMWDLQTKQCTVTLSGHTAGINAIDIRGDLLLSASLDCTLRVWNMKTHACTSVLEGHTDQVSHVNFFTPRPVPNAPRNTSSATQYAITGSLDSTLRVWDISANKCLHVLQGHTSGITSMAVCHQYAASGSVDGTIMVWDLLQGRRIFSLSGHTDRVTGLQFDFPTSRLVSCSWDFTARVWDLKTGTCTHVLKGHVFRIRCLSLNDNVLLTGGWDFDVRAWDLSTGMCIRTLAGHTNYVWGCEFVAGGQRAVSSSWDNTVRVWDTKSGKLLTTLDHVSEVLCLHANSHRVVGASKEIRVWDYGK